MKAKMIFCLLFISSLVLLSGIMPDCSEWRCYRVDRVKSFDYGGNGNDYGWTNWSYNLICYDLENFQTIDSVVTYERSYSYHENEGSTTVPWHFAHTSIYETSNGNQNGVEWVRNYFMNWYTGYMETDTIERNSAQNSIKLTNSSTQFTGPTITERLYTDDGRQMIVNYCDGNYNWLYYGSYLRFITEFDSTGLKINEIRYSSNDSLNWTPAFKYVYHYLGGTLFADFAISKFTSASQILDAWIPELVDNRLIDNVQVYQYEDGNWAEINGFTFEYISQYDIRIFGGVSTLPFIDYRLYYSPDGRLNGYTISTAIEPSFTTTSENYSYYWQSTTTPLSDDYVSEPEISISTYPNPFFKQCQIKLCSKSKAPVELSVYNIKGQLIMRRNTQDTDIIQWDGTNMEKLPVANGVYLVKAKQGNRQSVTRILKIK